MSEKPPISLDITPLWPAFLVKFVPPVDPAAVANEIKNLQLADPEGRLKSNYGGWQSKIIRAPKFENTLPALSVVRNACEDAHVVGICALARQCTLCLCYLLQSTRHRRIFFLYESC